MKANHSALRLRLPEITQERHATWLELFFDLVFVVAVAQLADRLSNHLTYLGVLQFCILFIPVWWAWVGHTIYATRFDSDDLFHRFGTFAMMLAAAVMAIQIPIALETGANGFVIGYIIARCSMLLLYLRTFLFIPEANQLAKLYLKGFGLGISFWVISIFIPEPYKFIFWVIGIVCDLSVPWIGKSILAQAPLDTIHIPERFGLFTIIVLGETILSVVLGLTKANWHLHSAIAGIFAFILAILIWWLYYSYTQIADYKCSLRSGQPFIYGHLPLLASVIIIGVCCEHLITQSYARAVYEELNLILCGAVLLWIIAFLFLQHMTIRLKKLRSLDKSYAVAVVAVLLIFLLHALPPVLLLGLLNLTFIGLLWAELTLLK